MLTPSRPPPIRRDSKREDRLRAFRAGGLLTALTLILGCGDGIPDFTAEELAQATNQVREAYRIQDYEAGAELGQEWSAWAPDAVELKAWTAANLAKASKVGAAARLADELSTSHPDSPWAAFAVASSGVWSFGSKHESQAKEAAERATAGLPNLVEAHILRWEVLYAESRDSASAYFENLPETLRSHPDIRASQARTLWPRTIEPADSVLNRVVAEYEEILAEHPDHLQTTLDASLIFSAFAEDEEKSVELVRRAAAMTPSPTVHGRLWSDIYSDPDLSDEEKGQKISADVDGVLATADASPARLAAMAYWLRSAGLPDLQAQLEERVLKEASDGPAAETVLRNRFQVLTRQLWGEAPTDPDSEAATKSTLAGMLAEFLDRREHHDPEYLFDALWARFILAKEDPSTDVESLTKIATRLVDHMKIHAGRDPSHAYATVAMALAEYPEALEEAGRIVELGKLDFDTRHSDDGGQEADQPDAEADQPAAKADEIEAEADETGGPDAEVEEADAMAAYAESQRKAQAAVLSAALGKILLAQGQLDEADKELEAARDLKADDYLSNNVLPFSYLHSGRLALRRAEEARAAGLEEDARESLEAAEKFFLEGIRLTYYADPGRGLPWVNPNERGLEELYALREGSLEGFDDYLAAARDEGWEERRDKVLEDRLEEPKPMLAFTLETLDGEEVTSESLLGRVLVINFWGTW